MIQGISFDNKLKYKYMMDQTDKRQRPIHKLLLTDNNSFINKSYETVFIAEMLTMHVHGK